MNTQEIANAVNTVKQTIKDNRCTVSNNQWLELFGTDGKRSAFYWGDDVTAFLATEQLPTNTAEITAFVSSNEIARGTMGASKIGVVLTWRNVNLPNQKHFITGLPR